jgi:GT2 family glycosyltransferase
MTLIHLIAVNYFGATAVERLIRSLMAQSHHDWRLTVVDNSESEEQVANLRGICSREHRAQVVVAPSNLGYAHAAEWVRSTRSVDATWIAVCNTDLQLADDFVAHLTTLGPEKAVLAPDVTAMPSLRKQNPYMLSRPTVARMLFRRIVLSNRFSARMALAVARSRPKSRQPSPEIVAREIYAPHGCFMLFHEEFFSRGGSLRHGTFLFGEEITIGERTRQLGLRVGYEPSLKVFHEEHQATGHRRTGVMFRAQREAAIHGYRLITGREDVG